MKIGYQGIEGAYSEIAAKQFFKSGNCELTGLKDFNEIFSQAHDGILDFAVVPIENSLAGSIHKNIDLLNTFNLKIVGEIYLRISHNLLGIRGSRMEDIKEVYSHWQALSQCEDTIRTILPTVKIQEYFDTAGSAKFVSDTNDVTKAAIASQLSAEKYDLEIIQPNFQDHDNNFTRFVVINRDFLKIKDEAEKYKTSIIFEGKGVPGFLYTVLGSFATRNINLTKIESRPLPARVWSYFFYIDLEGKFNDPDVRAALEEIALVTTNLKVLGSYPSGN